MATLPDTPKKLLDQLRSIFPTFAQTGFDSFTEEEDAYTFHGVMMAFTEYFGKNARACSPKQLQSFATLVNEAVKETDELENAISTCFLEHLHQIKVKNLLSPFLSQEAKQKQHA